MKIRDSGMAGNEVWDSFFNASLILEKMGLDGSCHTAVDLGCGYGTFSIPAAEIVRDKLIGFDIEPEMLRVTEQKARKRGIKNLELRLRDFVEKGTGLRDNSVDYVMVFNILHGEDPVGLLGEAYRILKTNGKVGIIHWNYDPNTPRGPSMEIRPKPEQCIQWAKEAGFEVKYSVRLPPYHYGIVGIK